MAFKEKTVWGVHAGKTGEANTLFIEKKFVALGWREVGDLSKLPATREAFKKRIAESYPDKKPGAIPVNAGQLFRYLHEMKDGDIVVYPSKFNRQVNIGCIEGPYQYNPKLEPNYPHLRPVKWLQSLPRTFFKQGALYELGSAMTFFQVKNFAEEFLAVLEGETSVISEAEDETVSLVAEDIAQITQDFILKQLAKEIKGHAFADFVGHLLETMGYRTRISPIGPDGGIDIIAHKDELGFEPPFVKVQVKSTEGSLGQPVVSQLYGNVSPGEFGLLVALGDFTSQAINFARGKNNLRLIDGAELIQLIFEHYEQFDSRYKGLIPLKKVYVPGVLETDE